MCLRYGNARDLCLGVEAVLADGQLPDGLEPVATRNGYDLRHLLIGLGGTLGIITAASLRLFPVPPVTPPCAWVAADLPAAALELLGALRGSMGGPIFAFELIHRQGLAFLAEALPPVPLPPPLGSRLARARSRSRTVPGSAIAGGSRRRWPRRSSRPSQPTRWSPRARRSGQSSGPCASPSPRRTG